MTPTGALRNDHDVLRSKLALLEGLLPLGHAARFPMREFTYSISRLLRRHMEQETRVLSRLRAMESPRLLAPTSALLDEHQDQRLTATLLLDLLLRGSDAPMDHIVLCASHLIEGSREHMAREETEVFPLIDEFHEHPVMQPSSRLHAARVN